jgi:hypothetical protein
MGFNGEESLQTMFTKAVNQTHRLLYTGKMIVLATTQSFPLFLTDKL